jgi:antitoxin component YwqK of YwqJK toxin-antitoxin module
MLSLFKTSINGAMKKFKGVITSCLMLGLFISCQTDPEGSISLFDNMVTDSFPEIYISKDSNLYTDKTNSEPANGHFESFYSDDSKKASVSFENGYPLDGSVWGEDGNMRLSFAKEEGRYTQYRYYENGVKAQRVELDKGVVSIGDFASWYEDGNPRAEFNSGVIRHWFPDVQMESEVHYNDGILHGRTAKWHKNGQLAGECFYIKGELDGEYVEWDEKGEMITEKEYEMGELVVNGEY